MSSKFLVFGFISILALTACAPMQLRAAANSKSKEAAQVETAGAIGGGYDSIDETNIDRQVTVRGLAQNAKLGAVVLTEEDIPIYIDRLAEWDSSIYEKPVVAIGVLRRRSLAPEPAVGSNGEISAGISRESYVLENSTWRSISFTRKAR